MERDRIWGAVALIGIVLTSFVYLLTKGIDSSPLLNVIVGMMPVISAVWVVQQVRDARREYAEKTADIKNDTAEIKHQVNGHLSTLTAKIPDPPASPASGEGGVTQ